MLMKRKNLFMSLGLLAVGLAGIAVVVVVFLLPDDPIPIGAPSSELAFISDRDGTWDIFILDAAGNLRNLTDDDSDFHDYFASWAFDSQMINFVSNRAGELGPAQVGPDGGNLRSLSVATGILDVLREGRFDWDPAWSPEGERLLWSSLRDNNLELYIAPADNLEERTRLTEHGFLGPRDWFGAWSPDGARVVFGSDREGDENIYIMNTDGSGLLQLTDDPEDDFHAMFSLDGESILFVSERDVALTTGEIGLYWINPDGSGLRRFVDGDVFAGDPMYSADGQQIAYMSNEEGDWNIYVMDADGSNVTRVTDSSANEMFPVWRPKALTEEAES